VLTGRDIGRTGMLADPALYVALLMALFAALFGTRQVDATEHHHGMMLAIAVESLVKLAAIVVVGLFAWHWLGARQLPLAEATRTLFANTPPTGFVAQTLLGFLAILCLPRQFQVAVVECGDVRDIRRARWLFGGYLVVISAMVMPIAVAGAYLFGGNTDVAADSIVLALPLAEHRDTIALIAYVGGFSAATGMTIVSSIALATMVSNDLIMPLLLRRGWGVREGDTGMAMRCCGCAGWPSRCWPCCLRLLPRQQQRHDAGQLRPDGLRRGGAVRARVDRRPVLARRQPQGRGAGPAGRLSPGLHAAAAGADPRRLAAAFVAGARPVRPGLAAAAAAVRPERLGCADPRHVLVAADQHRHDDDRLGTLAPDRGRTPARGALPRPVFARPALAASAWPGKVSLGELRALAERIVGERHARRAFAEQALAQGKRELPLATADRAWVQFTERLLAASIGAASARLVLTSVLRGSGMDVGEVVAVLDEAGQELRFNREILSTTLENISSGVSVVDPEMRLVAWNHRYQEMFDYPDGMLYVGRPVADLIRYNGMRGELGEGDIEEQVGKRIHYMRVGSPHIFERVRSNGTVIEMRGQPLPGGGYVTSYNDVTDFKRAESALRESNETLEQRVAERTREAEMAQQSRTRFLAAISHDVLQPLNAARLFASALRDSAEGENRHLAERVDASLRAAEELLDGLLDVSRLDAGGMHADVREFDVSEVLQELAAQYAPVAAGRNLKLHVHAPHLWVRSDRRLLRRVLQNFMANALRYTRSGRIVLGARLRGQQVELQVFDTGPASPSTTCGRSSTSSTATSSLSTGASAASAWACRSASASRACSTTASTRAARWTRAACSRSRCRGCPRAPRCRCARRARRAAAIRSMACACCAWTTIRRSSTAWPPCSAAGMQR
jgi:PAS domain-containing protein